MKSLLCVCAGLLMTFTTITAFAADVTGTWTGEMKGPNGDPFQITFTFSQDGAKLAGTVLGPQGDPTDISNGKIEGDKLSFDVSFGGMTIKHEGTIAGDEIKLTVKADDPNSPGGEMTLKRAK